MVIIIQSILKHLILHNCNSTLTFEQLLSIYYSNNSFQLDFFAEIRQNTCANYCERMGLPQPVYRKQVWYVHGGQNIEEVIPVSFHFPCPLIPCHAVLQYENVPPESGKGCVCESVCGGGESRRCVQSKHSILFLTSEVLLCHLQLLWKAKRSRSYKFDIGCLQMSDLQ